MGRQIDDIFEEQEAEDRLELQTNYSDLIQREFKDAEVILSGNRSGMSWHMGRHLVLSQVPVRIAAKFDIRKHTTVLIPYHHSHDFYELTIEKTGKGQV